MKYRNLEPEQATLDVLVERQDPTRGRPTAAGQVETPREPPTVGLEAIEYLRGVADHPGMAATERDAALGVSSRAGTRLRKLLFDKGLICEQWDGAIQHGQSFRDLLVTAVGRDVLRTHKRQKREEQASMQFDERDVPAS